MIDRKSIQKYLSTATPTQSSPRNASISVFPRELREDRRSWPCVSFSAENQFVFLPIPPNLTFSDNISYSSINLGLIGQTAVDTIRQLSRAGSATVDSMEAGLGGALNSMKERLLSGNSAAAASIAARLSAWGPRQVGFAAEYADKIDFANRQVLSPNTNTAFESPGLRTFAFGFNLVPRDARDSDAIRDAVSFFRKYAYPEGNSVFLKYPPIWSIKFWNGAERNRYIPGIYGCYLTGVASTYNAGTNLFHRDGSPVEVDVGLTFQETKVLTRDEIDRLNRGEGDGP